MAIKAGHSPQEARQIADRQASEPGWIARLKTAMQFCETYRDAVRVFGDAFHLGPQHQSVIAWQSAAIRLIDACEAARAWKAASGSAVGYEYQRQLNALRKQRAQLASCFDRAAIILGDTNLAVDSIVAESLRAAHLSYEWQGVRERLLELVREQLTLEDGYKSTGPLMTALEKALLEHGITETSSYPQLNSPAYFGASDKLSIALKTAAKMLHSHKPAHTSGRSEESIRIGNLILHGHRRRLPKMPSTGLAAQLVLLLTEMSLGVPGQSYRATLVDIGRLGRPHYAVAAAFVRAALKIDYSAEAAAKAVKGLVVSNNTDLRPAWEAPDSKHKI